MLPSHAYGSAGSYGYGKRRGSGGGGGLLYVLAVAALGFLVCGWGWHKSKGRITKLGKQVDECRSQLSTLQMSLQHERGSVVNMEQQYQRAHHSLVEAQRTVQELKLFKEQAQINTDQLRDEMHAQIVDLQDQLDYERETVEAFRKKLTELEAAHKNRETDWHMLSNKWRVYEEESTRENMRLLKELAMAKNQPVPNENNSAHQQLPPEEPQTRPETQFNATFTPPPAHPHHHPPAHHQQQHNQQHHNQGGGSHMGGSGGAGHAGGAGHGASAGGREHHRPPDLVHIHHDDHYQGERRLLDNHNIHNNANDHNNHNNHNNANDHNSHNNHNNANDHNSHSNHNNANDHNSHNNHNNLNGDHLLDPLDHQWVHDDFGEGHYEHHGDGHYEHHGDGHYGDGHGHYDHHGDDHYGNENREWRDNAWHSSPHHEPYDDHVDEWGNVVHKDAAHGSHGGHNSGHNAHGGDPNLVHHGGGHGSGGGGDHGGNHGQQHGGGDSAGHNQQQRNVAAATGWRENQASGSAHIPRHTQGGGHGGDIVEPHVAQATSMHGAPVQGGGQHHGEQGRYQPVQQPRHGGQQQHQRHGAGAGGGGHHI